MFGWLIFSIYEGLYLRLPEQACIHSSISPELVKRLLFAIQKEHLDCCYVLFISSRYVITKESQILRRADVGRHLWKPSCPMSHSSRATCRQLPSAMPTTGPLLNTSTTGDSTNRPNRYSILYDNTLRNKIGGSWLGELPLLGD